nr:spermidine synthase [Pseudobdellovibrionaceae bacterium]
QGIVITQSESPMFHEKTFVELNQCLKRIFGAADVHTLLFHATTYPSGMWSLMMGTKGGVHPQKSFDAAQAASFSRAAKLRYYHEGMQQSAFTLPAFVREMLNER